MVGIDGIAHLIGGFAWRDGQAGDLLLGEAGNGIGNKLDHIVHVLLGVGAAGKQHVSGGKRLIEVGERLVGVLIAIDFPGFGHGLVQVLRGWLHRSFGLFDE